MTDSDQVTIWKLRLRYGLVAVGIAAGLLVGGYILPAHWITVLTTVFAG